MLSAFERRGATARREQALDVDRKALETHGDAGDEVEEHLEGRSRLVNDTRIPSARRRAPVRLALLACAALAAACAASSKQLVPMPPQDVELSHPELCRVYVFRSSQVMGSPRTLQVFDGETEIGKLAGDEYLCWERPAGRSLQRVYYDGPRLTAGEREQLLDLQAAPGSVHYFGISLRRTSEQKAHGGTIGSPRLESLSADEGRELLKQTKPASAR
jgi:hypothetical protein